MPVLPRRHGPRAMGSIKSPETAASGLILRLDDEFLVTGGYVTSLRNIVPTPFRPIKAATGCIGKSDRGIAVFRRNQMCGSDRACPTNGSNHSPLEGESPACACLSRWNGRQAKRSACLPREAQRRRQAAGRQKPSRSLSLSKGRRRLMRWGDRNTFLLAGNVKMT